MQNATVTLQGVSSKSVAGLFGGKIDPDRVQYVCPECKTLFVIDWRIHAPDTEIALYHGCGARLECKREG